MPETFFSILIEIIISWLWVNFNGVAISSYSLVAHDAMHNLFF